MAEPLKNQYGPAIPAQIARMISGVWKDFDQKRFLADCLDGYETLELMPRGRRIAAVLKKYLPANYPKALDILIRSMGPVNEKTPGDGMSSFLYLPHAFFVAANGLDHFEESMWAQYEITQRFTAEFSIRPFLERHPRQTLARLQKWSRDPSDDVRRLVSEGSRPRLPWAPHLRAFQKDPAPTLELLELLKDDPSLYVRRSVANHLNDIGKDHPDILIKRMKKWSKDAGAHRKWIIRQALRSLVKKGDPEALRILGFYPAESLVVCKKQIAPAKVAVGKSVRFSFEIVNSGKQLQEVMIDFRIHFVKAGGKTRIKVFKLKSCTLGAGEGLGISKMISMKNLSTRKHYPGEHRIDLLINGEVINMGRFLLLA